MQLLATIVLTLFKLLIAVAILALGWIVLFPSETSGWRAAQLLEPWINRVVLAFPVERGAWGVLVVALGGASVLAALPRKAVARSRGRTLPRTAAFTLPEEGPQGIPAIPAGAVLVSEAGPAPHVAAPVEIAAQPEAPIVAPWDLPKPKPQFVEAAPVASSEPPRAEEPDAEPAQVDPPEAEMVNVSHETQVAEARQTLLEHPSIDARRRLADLLKKTGDIERGQGRAAPAIEAYEQSAVLRREVLAEHPGDPHEVRGLWTTLENLADCLDDQGHSTQAASLYREALQYGESAITLAPNETQYPLDLEAVRKRLAELEAAPAV